MTQPVRQYGPTEEMVREIATTLNLVLQGRINCTGSITVANGTTSTVVPDVCAYESSVPLLIATNSAAAAISPYVSARAAGSFTLTHADPGASATFLYVLLG